MKRISLLMAILLATAVSQASVQCNVNSGDPKQDMVFDQILYTGDVSAPRYLIIKKGATSAELIDFQTYGKKWLTVNGATLVTLSQQQNGEYSITVGHVDISKAKTNALPLDAMAIGPVTDQQFLNLIVPAKNLSVVCFGGSGL